MSNVIVSVEGLGMFGNEMFLHTRKYHIEMAKKGLVCVGNYNNGTNDHVIQSAKKEHEKFYPESIILDLACIAYGPDGERRNGMSPAFVKIGDVRARIALKYEKIEDLGFIERGMFLYPDMADDGWMFVDNARDNLGEDDKERILRQAGSVSTVYMIAHGEVKIVDGMRAFDKSGYDVPGRSPVFVKSISRRGDILLKCKRVSDMNAFESTIWFYPEMAKKGWICSGKIAKSRSHANAINIFSDIVRDWNYGIDGFEIANDMEAYDKDGKVLEDVDPVFVKVSRDETRILEKLLDLKVA